MIGNPIRFYCPRCGKEMEHLCADVFTCEDCLIIKSAAYLQSSEQEETPNQKVDRDELKESYKERYEEDLELGRKLRVFEADHHVE